MMNVMIYDQGRRFRVFHVDEETQERREMSASYRLVDMVVTSPEGERLSGFFFGEIVGMADAVDEKRAAKALRS